VGKESKRDRKRPGKEARHQKQNKNAIVLWCYPSPGQRQWYEKGPAEEQGSLDVNPNVGLYALPAAAKHASLSRAGV